VKQNTTLYGLIVNSD